MATLTGTQKKQKKSFIVMLIAIVLVAAAIAYVLFCGLSAKSSLFDNQKFAAALSQNIGKAPAFVKQEDLASVKYLSVMYDADGKQYSLLTGGSDFIDMYEDYNAKTEAGENTDDMEFSAFIKDTYFKGTEKDVLDDIRYFTGLEMIELSGVKVTDSSVFAGMKDLVTANIYQSGITEVEGFTGLDAEKVDKITIMENGAVTDWSPLLYLQDKVIVNSYYTIEPDEEGNYTFVPVEQTLTEYLAEQEEAAEADEGEETEVEETEETEESEEPEVSEETEEPAEEASAEEVGEVQE